MASTLHSPTSEGSAAGLPFPGGVGWVRPARWLGVAFLALAAMWLPLWGLSVGGSVVGWLLLAVPLGAAAACLATAAKRRLTRASWLCYGGAASSGVAVLSGWGVGGDPGGPVMIAGQVAFHGLFVAGTVLALWPLRGRLETESVADAALIAGMAAYVVLRLPVGPGEGDAELVPAVGANVVAARIGGFAALTCAGLLLAGPRAPFPWPVAAALGAAALGVTTGFLMVGTWALLVPLNGLAEIPFLLGWLALAAAAVAVWNGRDDTEGLGSRPGVRLWIAPAAAIVLGLAVLEAVWRPQASVTEAAVLAGVGVLLALRMGQAAQSAYGRREDRRELARTKALVAVSRALAGATRLDRTLSLVASWSTRVLDARASILELLIDNGRTLEIRAASGLPPEAVGMRFPLDQSYSGWVVRAGKARVVADASSDPFIQPQSVPLVGRSAVAAMPLRFKDEILGVLAAIRDRPFDQDEAGLLQALADQAAIAIQNANLFEQVQALSVTDPLTGLANRRQLHSDLNREFSAAVRGRELVAVLFDLDGFKEYNDRYGHLVGDNVLRAFARVLDTETRAMNRAVRFGGDEFLTLLSDSDMPGAEIFASRVCARFSEEAAALGFEKVSVTAGIAAYAAEMRKPEDLIAAADRALYRAKAARERV